MSAGLADAPPWVSQRESEIRMHVHDAIHRDHDKDFRCVAVFPCEVLRNVVLRVWRADFRREKSTDEESSLCCIPSPPDHKTKVRGGGVHRQ